MKLSNIKKVIHEKIFPVLSDYAVEKRLAYKVSECGLLYGIYVDDSSYNEDLFCVEVFIMPLFVPSEHLYFNYGFRMRSSSGNEWWDISSEDMASLSNHIQTIALPYLQSVKDLNDFVNNPHKWNESNPNWMEAKALALCYLHDERSFIINTTKDLVYKLNAFCENQNLKWVQDKTDQANELLDGTLEGNLDVRNLLENNISKTLDHLKIVSAEVKDERVGP